MKSLFMKHLSMKRLSVIILAIIAACTLIGCSSARQATKIVHEVSNDSSYQSNVQYDSIIIYQDRLMDRTRDTIYIKDKTVEYRYKMLRDTVYRLRIDSIPVVREVELVREVRHIPWYAKFLSWTGALAIIILLIRIILSIKL